jgi:hypothetical protein
MKFAIVITTYQRKDKRTPNLIKRALDSIFLQTHTDFKVYVIGDKYENNNEFIQLFNDYPKHKVYFENLPFAKERDVYTNKTIIWKYGGCFANNYGIEKALSEGFEYICHLDHDDYWLPFHLESIKKCINLTNADWVCTRSKYVNNSVLPLIKSSEEIIEFMPQGGKLIHSSVCMNFKKIPLKHRNVYEETGSIGFAGDWDLWERVRDYIVTNNLKSYLVNKITCIHDEEGYSKNS